MFRFISAANPEELTDPARTLGIEVTIPAVAERCGLGNLDGQHGLPDTPWLFRGLAAIQIAAYEPLHNVFDHSDSILVTVRPDLDSIGAMAVIVLRSLGYVFYRENDLRAIHRAMGENVIGDETAHRIRDIARADSFIRSHAWEPSPLPTVENPWPRAGSVDSIESLAHVAVICSPRHGDRVYTLPERVAIVATWLLSASGECTPQTINAIYRACGLRDLAERDQYDIDQDRVEGTRAPRHAWDALRHSRERVTESRQALAVECARSGAVEARDGVAILRVAHAGALGVGYCVAPVVVAFDQATPGKVTICAWNDRYLDVPALKARLNALEPGWGGPSAMCCSPQGTGTALTEEQIIAAVQACVR